MYVFGAYLELVIGFDGFGRIVLDTLYIVLRVAFVPINWVLWLLTRRHTRIWF